jgi:hypothetical protein
MAFVYMYNGLIKPRMKGDLPRNASRFVKLTLKDKNSIVHVMPPDMSCRLKCWQIVRLL